MQGRVTNKAQIPLRNAIIIVESKAPTSETDSKGAFKISLTDTGAYNISCTAIGFQTKNLTLDLKRDTIIHFVMDSIKFDFDSVVLVNDKGFYIHPVVFEQSILASKTIHTIELAASLANLTNNNARQIFQKVPGLNIWENDQSGIQLNIAGRGLSPNRSSNFNTRQNGYDISADALGYPEAYYTPPALALERIDVIRGAAGLQFGPQFGGMINFVLKKGTSSKAFEFCTEQSYGANNFFNSFTSMGGSTKDQKFNYFAYINYKRGDGWRPNSDFEYWNAHFNIHYKINKVLKISLEHSAMSYLAHQPGGLTENQFMTDPRSSSRTRNWFKVNWNITSLNFKFKISPKLDMVANNFLLYADRSSLGNLQAINRPDYGYERDLIKGNFLNFGHESRLMFRYDFFDKISALAAGIRVYSGSSYQQQGMSNAGSDGGRSDFEFSDGINALNSDYFFPSFNFAAYIENHFPITKKFSLTPGLRYEYIQTAAEGTYRNLVIVNNQTGVDTLVNENIPESRQTSRSVVLAGLGASYKFNENLELYTNFSQNYRAINFNDIRINNPNREVDPDLKDEYGFNYDLGIKGNLLECLNFSFTGFYLSYNRKIGNIQGFRPDPDNSALMQSYVLRTNIGDAYVVGCELYSDLDLLYFFKKINKKMQAIVFLNASYMQGQYINTKNSYSNGKQLAYLAPWIIRTGLNFYFRSFSFSYQLSYTSSQYSDATNAENDPKAVIGLIPAYLVQDVSASYEWKWFKFSAGLNNLGNQMYFTRRASSYPGPGILPADGIGFYVSLKFTVGTPSF